MDSPPTHVKPPEPTSAGEPGSDLFARLEADLERVAGQYPRLEGDCLDTTACLDDLRALLEVSQAVNSSLIIDDVLQIVMRKAIHLLNAERGFIMLLDKNGDLNVRAAFNLNNEDIRDTGFTISQSIARQVAETGAPVFTSDAQSDERYAQQHSVIEFRLRSIMCVPLIVHEAAIGVIYVDNSETSPMFLKSDLYLFTLYAHLASNALHNAEAHDALARLRHFGRSVVQHSPVGIVVLDTQAGILRINRAALEIFDLDSDRVQTGEEGGQPTLFFDTLPEDEQPRWRSIINIVLTTRQEAVEPRFYYRSRYLEKILSLKVSPLSNLPDGSSGLIMTVEDVTDRVHMEQYVILSEKLVARGEMAASVAHELNNYLSIIANNAELLSLNVSREKYDKVQFNCRSIIDSVFKIKRFAESLMDFSKPEPEYISYDIKRLIDDLLFSLRVESRFKSVHFTIDLAEQIPLIEMDVGQVQQVLINLLNNASDAIEELAGRQPATAGSFKRAIGIAASFDKQRELVQINVSDNGAGMTDEVLSKVFSLHFTTKKGGNGLGLYNCRQIAQQHGGELTVRSTPGAGSIFSLTLPRIQRKPRKKA